MTPEKYKPRVSVCLLLKNEQNQVLLCRRYNTGYQDGKYEFPAGHIEQGETLEEAIIREIYEETGLHIEKEHLVFVGCVDNNAKGNHLNFLFETNHFKGSPKIMESEECDDMLRINLDETINREMLSIDTQRFLDIMQHHRILKSYK